MNRYFKCQYKFIYLYYIPLSSIRFIAYFKRLILCKSMEEPFSKLALKYDRKYNFQLFYQTIHCSTFATSSPFKVFATKMWNLDVYTIDCSPLQKM